MHYVLITIFSLGLGCSMQPIEPLDKNLAEYETELLEDQNFVKAHKTWLDSEFLRINKYFEIEDSPQVKIEILPYHRNSEFKNCARTYGSSRIYAHSPTDLKSADLNSGVNSYCLSKTYQDLKYTLVHEYVHSRALLVLKTNPLPNWVWEGAAVALSGELYNADFRKEVQRELMHVGSIDLCSDKHLEKKPYHFGGITLLYFEKKYSGFIRKVIQQYKNNKSADIRKLIRDMVPSCKITIKELNDTCFTDLNSKNF